MTTARTFTALVLAGTRHGVDPLAAASGVSSKALAPVAGEAMLARVLRALQATPSVTRIVVCGLSAADAGDVGDGRTPVEFALGRETPGASAAHVIADLELPPPLLITTADHPLLTPATLEEFCVRTRDATADAVFGLVSTGLVHDAFPGVRRTAYRFREGGFCGCNLYGLLTPAGREAPALWAEVEGHRKRPWRLMQTLGYGTLLRFVLGRLALADVQGLVFARTKLRVRPVFLSDPAAGFDVDTPEQRTAAETFLLTRGELAAPGV